MGVTSADLATWVQAAMTKEGIRNYKLDVSGNSVKGDGYLGEVTFVEVTPDLGSKRIHLVVKSAKTSDEFRQQTPVKEAYERETFMYTRVFPVFEEFQKEFAAEARFDKLARCYGACSENKKEALIMENLKVAGFEIHDRYAPQNLNHALYVFQNYGKLHAVSLAMKLKEPVLFEKLTRNMTDVMGKFLLQSKLVPSLTKCFESAVEVLQRNGREDLAGKYRKVKDGLEECLTGYVNPEMAESVILHGDCWNNNMMFKYEGGNKTQPVDMRFIDFQLSRVASPVFDLSYYLYTCTDKSVLANFHFLLQAYHSSLSEAMKKLRCDCDKLFSFEQKYGRYGLALAPWIVKIELCRSDEVVDFAESAERGEGMDKMFDFELQDQAVYESRMADVLGHFAEEFLSTE
ncbi:hypothetical protein NQ315_009933 [Exocentrus adspersus]|uniref:CHK kinase-like domain-containing protein n=1 Tax=Exocentrus adspersus TaxID=1586481 RepID=A0AAV8WIK2_9CUCU|nr:hypothetical protein NQ315_009933 [Exocentrus adspersus]